MIQADDGFSSRETTPSTGNKDNLSPQYPDEKIFRLNRDVNFAVHYADEIHDRADTLVEVIGELQKVDDIGDFKAMLRSIEYQVIDIRRIASYGVKIGTVQ